MRRENRALAWALLVSLLFHGALLVAPPAFWETVEHATRTPPPITARLVEPPPPAPPPAPAAPPPKKEASKPLPALPPLPEKKPRPIRKEAAPQVKEKQKPREPARERAEIKPAPPASQPAPPVAQPEALPAPQPEAPPAPQPAPPVAEPALPAPLTAPPVQAREPDIPSLIGQYAGVLKSEMRRQVKYPARARDEGWEGEGRLLLVVGEDGKVAQLSVVKSSGYALLDRTLLEGARRAQARVEVPAGLRGRRFRLEIPFVMNLVDE